MCGGGKRVSDSPARAIRERVAGAGKSVFPSVAERVRPVGFTGLEIFKKVLYIRNVYAVKRLHRARSKFFYERYGNGMHILFLVGPRGSGKTSIARLLAAKHGCREVDTDRLVFSKTGRSVAEIVAEGGWPAFRQHESEALREAAAMAADSPARFGVVATGGGIVLDAANRAFMREKGKVAYLAAPPEVLVARLARSANAAQRPPLSGLSFEEEIRAVARERDPLYREAAHLIVNASLPTETVVRVLSETFIRALKD